MKKLTVPLFSLIFTSALFCMESEEPPANHYINFNKIEKRQLQEKNNALLQENNNLLHQISRQNEEIKRQNKAIIYQNYISFEHEIILVETHRTLAVGESEIKAKLGYQKLMRAVFNNEIKYDKI